MWDKRLCGSPSVFESRAMRRMTLPIVLIDLMPCVLVPIVTLAVAWALYSTEELAKLLDEPFGRPGREPTPETVPVERCKVQSEAKA